MTINLAEETSELFKDFVSFLYIPGWVPPINTPMDLIRLPRLYAMGERLMAQEFQDVVLRVLRDTVKKRTLEATGVMLMLRSVCNEVIARPWPNDDRMRDHVFWFATKNLSSLRKSPSFIQFLDELPEVGKQLSLRAGDTVVWPPTTPFTPKKEKLHAPMV